VWPPCWLAFLPLGVLRSLASTLEARLLALLDPRVSGHQAVKTEGSSVRFIELHERPCDSVCDRTGLAGRAAPGNLNQRIVGTVGIGDSERKGDHRLPG